MFGYGKTRRDLDWTMHERVDFRRDYNQVWGSGDSRDAECAKLPLLTLGRPLQPRRVVGHPGHEAVVGGKELLCKGPDVQPPASAEPRIHQPEVEVESIHVDPCPPHHRA